MSMPRPSCPTSWRKPTVHGVLCLILLSLGLGAAMTAWALIERLWIRPLPYPHSDRLVALVWDTPQGRQEQTPIATLDDLALGVPSAETFCAFRSLGNVPLERNGRNESLTVCQCSWNTLDVLGAPPMLGAAFQREHEDLGTQVLLLNHQTWLDRFGADPGVIGSFVLLDGLPYYVLGVTPPHLELPGPTPAEALIPVNRVADDVGHGVAQHQVVARLKPGATLEAFVRDVESAQHARLRLQPTAWSGRPVPGSLQSSLRPPGLAPVLTLTAMAAALVLLIVFRAVRVRASFVLLCSALVLGVGISWVLLQASPAWLRPLAQTHGFERLGLTWGTLLCGGVMAALLGIGWNHAPQRPSTVVHSALSVALLALSALCFAALSRAMGPPSGFDPSNLWTMELRPPQGSYNTPEDVLGFQKAWIARLAAHGEVEGAAVLEGLPWSTRRPWMTCHALDGRSATAHAQGLGEGAFATLRTPLERGRELDRRDPQGLVINHALAQQLFPGRNPLGASLRLEGPGRSWKGRIVGVCQDLRPPGRAPEPAVWYPLEPTPGVTFSVLVRSALAPEVLQKRVEGELLALDPAMPTPRLVPLEGALRAEGGLLRLTAMLLGVSALLSLTLAAQSLHALVAKDGTGKASGLLPLILRQAGLGALIGLGAVTLLALAWDQPIHGVPLRNPAGLVFALLVFAITGSLAGLLPTLRARREETRRIAREAQWSLLKGQLHPHVFFNAMNNLTALIPKDPALAERAALDLADLFRRLMTHGHRPLASLGDERALLEAYLAVEALRFGPRLRCTWNWDPALDEILAPPFLLQPLVENALKHGIGPCAEGGELVLSGSMSQGRIALRVANTGAPLKPRRKGGLGLENLEGRLALFYGQQATLHLHTDGPWTYADLDFPILEERT